MIESFKRQTRLPDKPDLISISAEKSILEAPLFTATSILMIIQVLSLV